MDVKIVNCFVRAGVDVTKNFISGEIKTGKLTTVEKCCPSEEINIVLGVNGKLRGQIIYGMTEVVARGIISGMMGGQRSMKSTIWVIALLRNFPI